MIKSTLFIREAELCGKPMGEKVANFERSELGLSILVFFFFYISAWRGSDRPRTIGHCVYSPVKTKMGSGEWGEMGALTINDPH